MMREAQAISTELYERAAALGDERLAAHGKLYATPNPFFDNEARSPSAKDEAEAAYREVIATFEKLGDEAGVAAGKRRLALVYRSRSQHGRSVALLEEAILYAGRGGDPSTFRAVAYSLSNDLRTSPIPVAVAIARCEELLEASRDDRVLEAALSRQLGYLMAMAGRFDEARALVEPTGPVLDKAWVESASWGSLGPAAEAMRLYGDREGAKQAWLAKWRAYPVEDGKTQGLAIGACYALASLCCDEGRWAEAEEYASHYRARFPNDQLEARLAAHRGEFDRALSLARGFVERSEQSDSPNGRASAWKTLAEVERAAGNTDAANAALATAIGFYEQKGNVAAAEQLRGAALAAAAV
jgi:tetratricopeptide (TPR) repeat protein